MAFVFGKGFEEALPWLARRIFLFFVNKHPKNKGDKCKFVFDVLN